MGTQELRRATSPDDRRVYTQALLRDLRALERMVREGRIESGVHRVGAEQELVLVDSSLHPAPVSDAVLERIDDPRFTTELGRFNIEFNLDPIAVGPRCLSQLERDITAAFDRARRAAEASGCDAVMAGILPSLGRGHLDLAFLTDRPRYWALNDALTDMRGSHYEIRLKGRDELTLNHSSIMLEAANTSFQVHFQVSPEDFVRWYNAAQAATGAVLAAAANSPVLLGRRLWAETRIALFQQSIDTRRVRYDEREFQPRVSFGTAWARESGAGGSGGGAASDIFREDIARFRPLFALDDDEDPNAELGAGRAPKLNRLKLFNSTVYRWNRPCYGVGTDGTPHLRIENRVLPSGPTPADEVANAALWFGLVRGIDARFGDIAGRMAFDDAHQNFLAAAQHGLDAQLSWPGMGKVPARELLPLALLPLAREGLREAGVSGEDADRYIGLLERRVASGQNGATWALASLESMGARSSRAERMTALTAGIARHQGSGKPVHEWPLASAARHELDPARLRRVSQLMSTELFTVNDGDVIDLVLSLMEWQHVRHVPVEDDDHKLVGLVSHRNLLRYVSRLGPEDSREPVPVSEVMDADVFTVTPDTPTLEALDVMRTHQIGCLPVVTADGTLAGIITEHDLLEAAAPLLERHLAPRERGGDAGQSGL